MALHLLYRDANYITMKQTLRIVLATLPLIACSSGCTDSWRQATVTISFASTSESNRHALQSFHRARVEEVFRTFSKRYGYTCRSHIKRVKEIRCRGPQDLYVVFQPSLNEPKFTAKFSWADVGGRTHEAFTSHVLQFEQELRSIIGERSVRLEQGI